MKLILDVMYDEAKGLARTAAVEFQEFTDSHETAVHVAESPIASEYIPGEFFKRELPAIMAALQQIGLDRVKGECDAIVVDGLYMLGVGHPGLGARLKQHLSETYGIDVEVIGIAKTHFNGCESVAKAVQRGKDAVKPLYVNGSGDRDYAALVKSMAGDYRLPYLVKRVDTICRGR